MRIGWRILALAAAVPCDAAWAPGPALSPASVPPGVGVQRGIGASGQPARGVRRQRWAVVIGISRYADSSIRGLDYADADAKAFYDFLRSDRAGDGGFAQDHIELLVNADATYERIRTGLRTFLRSATDDDLVVIYFAGHGVADPDHLEELYLLAYDTRANNLPGTAVPMDDVRQATSRLYARDILVLVDACHSAGVGGQARRRGLESANRINDTFLNQLTRSSGGLAVFTASQVSQLSQEGPQWGGGHGVFTYHVLEALRGAADTNGDSIVTLAEMTDWVHDGVRRATRNAQTPTISQTLYDANLPLSITAPSRKGATAGASSVAPSGVDSVAINSGATVAPPAEVRDARAIPRPWVIAVALAILTVMVVALRSRGRHAATSVVGAATAPLPVVDPMAGDSIAAGADVPAAPGAAHVDVGAAAASASHFAEPAHPVPDRTDAAPVQDGIDPITAVPAAAPSEDGTLGGRYRLESELARAGSSVIYVAHDQELDRSVVVKVFQVSKSRGSQTDKFLREVRLLARLQHPNIVALYDHGSIDDAVYYVMPRLVGEPLRARLDRQGVLPVKDAIRIATQIAEALDYAHRQAVLHRNVRPESIWLTRSHALIAEFGLAKAFGVGAIGALTTVGAASLASADYSSPEQLVPGRDLDPRSDIYGLGCVLYEMVTGLVPYKLPSGEIDRRAKFSGPPVKASTLRAGSPAELDRVIEMAVDPDVDRRYGSAIEFARALANVASEHL